MKLAKSTLLAWLMVLATAGVILLTATGCKKAAAPKAIQPTLSPEQAKEQRLTWNLKTLVEAYEKAGHTSPKWDEPAKRALTEFARTRSKSTESNEAWGLIISTNCIAAVDLRVAGRDLQLTLSGDGLGCDFRLGVTKIELGPSGTRR